jgi:methyltransferase (TIGR00027 family)
VALRVSGNRTVLFYNSGIRVAIREKRSGDFSMREGSPSNTALWVAALRAAHQSVDGTPVFVDPLAVRLLASRPDLLDAAKASATETRRLRATLAARAVVAEAMIAEAVGQGVTQCVVLGAGLDTFAYRHGHAGLVVFEVDHPATQAAKRGLLREAAIAVGPMVRYVATDFAAGDIVASLIAAGFERGRPAILMMMGVVPYLELDVLLRLVGALADRCAAGSEIILDYTEPFDEAPAAIRKPYEAAAVRVAALGEPWVASYRPDALHAALRERGCAIVADLDAAALDARCFAGRTDGLRVAPLVHVLRARLEGRLQKMHASRHQGA